MLNVGNSKLQKMKFPAYVGLLNIQNTHVRYKAFSRRIKSKRRA